MAKKIKVQFRTDEQNEKEIEVMAASYGLGISAYLRMLVKRDYQNYASVKLVKVEAPRQPEAVAE
jgi:antitoxin component of RelBE/YafQ-DinJ toxin-antitoxin module